MNVIYYLLVYYITVKQNSIRISLYTLFPAPGGGWPVRTWPGTTATVCSVQVSGCMQCPGFRVYAVSRFQGECSVQVSGYMQCPSFRVYAVSRFQGVCSVQVSGYMQCPGFRVFRAILLLRIQLMIATMNSNCSRNTVWTGAEICKEIHSKVCVTNIAPAPGQEGQAARLIGQAPHIYTCWPSTLHRSSRGALVMAEWQQHITS